MLKVASFEITDAKGINDLLSKYRLASGAHILISEGKLAVPYEDGEAPNSSQKLVTAKEQMHIIKAQVDIIVHSQKVLEIQERGILKQIEDLKAETAGEPSREKKALEKINRTKITQLENVLNQTRNQMLMNQAEITQKMTNVQVYEDTISELEKNG